MHRRYADKTGPVFTGKNVLTYLNHMRTLAKNAGVEIPRNALRHSFASYHLAKFGDAARLALDMGHTTTKLIFEHYREIVRPDDGERYFNIFPPSTSGERRSDGASVSLKAGGLFN